MLSPRGNLSPNLAAYETFLAMPFPASSSLTAESGWPLHSCLDSTGKEISSVTSGDQCLFPSTEEPVLCVGSWTEVLEGTQRSQKEGGFSEDTASPDHLESLSALRGLVSWHLLSNSSLNFYSWTPDHDASYQAIITQKNNSALTAGL